ncbi:MAG: DHH family phosphoesterase [Sporolactobacillus sp.]
MSNPFNHRWRSDLLIVIGLLCLLFLAFVFYLNWMLALAGILILFLGICLFVYNERQFDRELMRYVAGLSYRLKKVGHEALLQMPIGILLYDENTECIQWCNPYLSKLDGNNSSFIGRSLEELSPQLPGLLHSDKQSAIIAVRGTSFRVRIKRDERLFYFNDVTDLLKIKRDFYSEHAVFAHVFLDNYDEMTQSVDDQVRSTISNELTAVIKEWALRHGMYLRRTASDRFFAVMNEKMLKKVEEERFAVLDAVREITVPLSHIPLTLSIGVGAGTAVLEDLGGYAQSALDLCLGRGGDQAVIKRADGEVKFYGGKSNPIEKRTRVRARVISHALSELMLESDQVLIMGHRMPDLDSVGACIGLMKIAQANERRSAIVLDDERRLSGISKLLEELRKDGELWTHFISEDAAVERLSARTLVVIADTHRPSMVVAPAVLDQAQRIVVVDHHRRAEEFVKNPVLVYMEPYASSTAELVTEMFEYLPNRQSLTVLEATAMLGGIALDTKNFMLRTGFRTFDAASYLRAHGADTLLMQKFLCDNLAQFNQRSALIQRTSLYRSGIAVTSAESNKPYDQVLIAQTADTLLTLEGIRSAFVIAARQDGKVGVSARSLGDMNVQVVMESLGGGGHLNDAAVQFSDLNVAEATDRVKSAIDAYLEGRLS